MGKKAITPEIIIAYSQCSRKAFFILFSTSQEPLHEYEDVMENYRRKNRDRYLSKIEDLYTSAKDFKETTLSKDKILINSQLKSDNLFACCDLLTAIRVDGEKHRTTYEPTIFAGSYKVTKEHKLELSFIGIILEKLIKQAPDFGKIVCFNGKQHRVNLRDGYKKTKPFLKTILDWRNNPLETPSLVINKHCQTCQFKTKCLKKAKEEDHLSLLNRMTPKAIEKYHQRGIFTVNQLSYLFRPRRNRKKRKDSSYVKHSLELQALAIREQKTYILEMPDSPLNPLNPLNPLKSIAIFLDIEGIPDQNFYYLIGVLVCENGNPLKRYSFWANRNEDEEDLWQNFLSKIREYPDAPIFHYGNYEKIAIKKLDMKYKTNYGSLLNQLININHYYMARYTSQCILTV